MIPYIKKHIKRLCTILATLFLVASGLSSATANDIPHVSLQNNSFTLDSNSHTIILDATFSSNITEATKDIYVELMNNDLTDITVTDIDIESGYLYVYIPANTSTTVRVIEITGKNSGSGMVTIVQSGITPRPEPDTPSQTEEKLNICGNWILKRTYTSHEGARYEDITFYNGLGYPEQVINISASATNKRNIITPIVYDSHMHDDAKVYLPYESTSNTTAVQENNPLLSQSAYYASLFGNDNGAYAYNENTYEASSLNRITAQWESGSNHRQSDRKTTITYGTNASEEVLLLTVDASANTLAVAGTYNSGTLHKTTTIDADSSIAVVYKDFDGRTVLERTMDAEQALDTYHVYDTYGNLRWVITPQGSGSLSAGTTYTTESTLAKQYCCIYSYDGMGNITQKRLPGRETEYYVYDKGGRMVLYQDGNLRSSNRWIHTTWDNLNREVEKNIIATTLSREELHNSYNNTGHSNLYYYGPTGTQTALHIPIEEYEVENTISTLHYYGYRYNPIRSSDENGRIVPLSSEYYLVVDVDNIFEWGAYLYDEEGIYFQENDQIKDEYYICEDDTYPNIKYYYIPQELESVMFEIQDMDPCGAYIITTEYPGQETPLSDITIIPENIVTTSLMELLPYMPTAICSATDLDTLHNTGLLQYERYLLLQHDTCTVPSYKETAHYYNSRSQLIQSVTKYPHSDSLHRMSYSYTFTGAPQSTIEEYNGITKRTDYTYDERCRLISETTTINDSAPATITYSYDALGKLISKTYGNGVTETINYNIQGWQTSTEVTNGNSNIYSQQLKYYNPTKGSTPLYTGNISEWSTTMGTQAMNTYGFEYDKLGRLKNTLHYSATATTPTAAYTERGITYDLNGNITTLKRYVASEATPEDDYQYIYTGNKLTQIAGTDNNATISDATYTYDSNGNLTHDGLKNLQISYNFLNLPSVVNQASAEIAKYSWFADGSKFSIITPEGDGYYYTGSLIYASNNGNLQIESTDFAGGRINLAQTGSAASGTNNTGSTLTQDIHYFHTDHLGSVRAITNDNGETVEQNAYYPFGSRHTFGATYAQTTNRFKFNGKEEQTSGNLGLLDYGARMYDANIGRWFVQDPLSEKYYSQSPYNYCVNNPVMFVDPDGMDVWIYYHDNKGNLQYFKYYGQEMETEHENEFVRQVIAALKFNITNGEKAKNGGGEVSKEAVYNPDIDIAIRYYKPKSEHDAQGGVRWNPLLASETDGAMLSPATILDHELNHAIQYKTQYRKWVDDRCTDKDYKTLEERRVITGSEQKTAIANGELKKGHHVTRRNHNGKYYITDSPVSNRRKYHK